MQGLAAISANNGWAMAVAGACIVMIGLATLSFIISQLHNFVGLLEKKEKMPEESSKSILEAIADAPDVEPFDLLSDLKAAARVLAPLTSSLGEKFTLRDLYQQLETEKHPHPHITVRELREAGYLTSDGQGSYSWTNI